MLPTIFPRPGTPVANLSQTVGMLRDVATQAARNARVELGGQLTAQEGPNGIQLSVEPIPQFAWFQIETNWTRRPPNSDWPAGTDLLGPTQGITWECTAKPVAYYWGVYSGDRDDDPVLEALQNNCEFQPRPDNAYHLINGGVCREDASGSEATDPNESYLKAKDETYRIYWYVRGPDAECGWQQAVAPKCGVGQWIYCQWDEQLSVWRALDVLDEIIRFQLLEDLTSENLDAAAYVLQFDSPITAENIGGPDPALNFSFVRSKVRVVDTMGVRRVAFHTHQVNQDDWTTETPTFSENPTVPACTPGWAKWCADAGQFEVIAYGANPPTTGSSSVEGSSSGGSESSTSEQPPSSGPPSSGPPSSGPPPSSGAPPSSAPPPGSSKSTAIVPAGWSPTGFTALFVEEAPEVRFNDTIIVETELDDGEYTLDPKYLEVCEPGTLEVDGWSCNLPVLVGASIEADHLRIRIRKPTAWKVRIVLRVTGIRKGFLGTRFPDRTREQFEANERFIEKAYGNGK